MKIIILGAGQVGRSVANALVSEANDITVVDQNLDLLTELQNRLDLGTVRGHAGHPDVLRRAGAEDADMILAVTNSDETNMVACQVAYTVFHTPTKIARVRAQGYLDYPKLFEKPAFPVDVLISPEQLVTDYILKLIEYPGALQVLDFADGRVRLVGIKAYYGGPLVGNELSTLYHHMPNVDARVAAIYREGEVIQPQGDTEIKAEDEVFFIAAAENIRSVMSELQKLEKPYKRLILAGGGNIGRRLASSLEHKYRIKLIENNQSRAREIAERLDMTIVLHGDAADEDLLLEENIENTDVFCAVTNDDEANILSAMLAKRLGAARVMALINRPSYVDLVQSGIIDIAISPQQATIGTLLTHVRRGDVAQVHSLRRGAAEAIEAVAHGDRSSSKVVGRVIEEIKLPKGSTIGAVVRGEEVLIAHHDTMIESGDHVILFLVDKRKIREVEKLFQVGVTFL
ncbi:MAG: Trk system potassium transporter TrkA [Candidatus Thiodiazotropha lotti]|uniref:Trk system potassium transporter TrkA n=1 Tax=Candidatus Thiodiazotropha endoloripes TaxID=1818881 RepID=UPI00083E3EB2|nr:Trk system potassium transporter TrkA [Candidatus Thiodiazotropha endoloripes]MCG7991660.1 Trk system potassium transporter TrkA [Candidatus Thiodiazotropha lotti]MCW4183315.1 Trk system potassium transporter TrkA [Candidatus Thiodiazotropha weberae]MCG7999684.1 Trk system potassium transporter TrkA [Candidatus Thiodiazotropha lotti]MCW4191452.1 Trk system potassium transporter TrkA [Candidatus Thiodiazotropha weberae]ODB84155.1 Trk system potassium transport protein TrkA [Candidatus Thiodi